MVWRSWNNAACTVALATGRYRSGHDQVLAVVVEMVKQEVMRSKKRGVEKEEEAHGKGVVCERGQVVRGGRRRRRRMWKARCLPMHVIGRWWQT